MQETLNHTIIKRRNTVGETVNGSSSFNAHLPILEGRNWERWSTSMKNLFGAHVLLEIVQIGYNDLDAMQPKFKGMRTKN